MTVDQEFERAHHALREARASGDVIPLIDALSSLGRILDGVGMLADAMDIYSEALTLAEQSHIEGRIAGLLNNIACVYMSTDDWEAAEDTLKRALHHLTESTSVFEQGRIWSNLTFVCIEQDRYQEAEDLLELTEADARSRNDTRRLLRALEHRGVLRRKQKRWREAQEALEACLAESERQNREDVRVNVLIELGRLYTSPESPHYSPEQAEALLQEAKIACETCGIVDSQRDAYKDGVALYRSQGRFEEALMQFEALHSLEQRIFTERSDQRMRFFQVREETERHRHQAEMERLRNEELAEALDEARHLRREAERLARHDSLTGLFNRRYIDETLAGLYQRARFENSPLCVALADIDDFKRINDDFSHATGDAVLQGVAAVLQELLRPTDILGRYGGEEFVILLPATSGQEAYQVCERLRNAVAALSWEQMDSRLHVTLSLGLCDDLTLPSPDRLLQTADRNLYRAKAGGKNLVLPL
jgi:diguanylate cyclase (GGDEF)-like protein